MRISSKGGGALGNEIVKRDTCLRWLFGVRCVGAWLSSLLILLHLSNNFCRGTGYIFPQDASTPAKAGGIARTVRHRSTRAIQNESTTANNMEPAPFDAGIILSRLGQIVIRPNRHSPRFLRPDLLERERKVDRWSKKVSTQPFAPFHVAWAAPT